MTRPSRNCRPSPCRSPHGERGLKCRVGKAPVNEYRRSPHGERGLK